MIHQQNDSDSSSPTDIDDLESGFSIKPKSRFVTCDQNIGVAPVRENEKRLVVEVTADRQIGSTTDPQRHDLGVRHVITAQFTHALLVQAELGVAPDPDHLTNAVPTRSTG